MSDIPSEQTMKSEDYGNENVMVTGAGVAGNNSALPTESVVITTTLGRKFDGGKLEYGLLPPYALEETVKVLTFGAQKYERNNWIHVEDAPRRYFDALQRHLWAWKKGEQMDPESGLHHLAHAMCCLMFLYERDVIYNDKDVK